MLTLIPLIAAQILALAPGSKLWIEGDSNLHPWSCSATRPESKIEVDPDSPGIARSLSLLVEVDGLECGNGKMNDKLREALHSDKHPWIEYNLLTAERVPGAALKLRATGELTVAGKTRQVSFLVDVEMAADGTAKARGTVEILMTDFGVEPPSALLGMVKTYDKITVRFEIQTIPFSTAHASAP
jgi:polyisoprenoid-binding protein YceI